MSYRSRIVHAALVAGLTSVAALPTIAADADAALALVEKSKCFDCHQVDRAKDGPAWKEVAKKYRGKPEAPEKLYKHATTRPMVKVNGNMEEHAVLKSKNPSEIRNVIEWILSL